MLSIVVWYALALGALNWILFVVLACMRLFSPREKLLEELIKLLRALQDKGTTAEAAKKEAIDPGTLAAAAGALADAFKKAGPAATAAAIFVICLALALVAARGGNG